MENRCGSADAVIEELNRLCAVWPDFYGKLRENSNVKGSSRLRVNALHQDVTCIVEPITEIAEKLLSELRQQTALFANIQIPMNANVTTLVSSFVQGKRDNPFRLQFAAFIKAFYFFTRSFQNALYSLMLESVSQSSGNANMQACLSSTNNPYRNFILAKEPLYAEWFNEMREIRNDCKFGIDQSQGGKLSASESGVFLNFRVIREIDGKRSNEIKRQVSLLDIQSALEWCRRLVLVVDAWIELGENALREKQKVSPPPGSGELKSQV